MPACERLGSTKITLIAGSSWKVTLGSALAQAWVSADRQEGVGGIDEPEALAIGERFFVRAKVVGIDDDGLLVRGVEADEGLHVRRAQRVAGAGVAGKELGHAAPIIFGHRVLKGHALELKPNQQRQPQAEQRWAGGRAANAAASAPARADRPAAARIR